MDFGAVLFDPIYSLQGVTVNLTLASGVEFTGLTALDKTAGINVGENADVPTILPAAFLRMSEINDRGIDVKELPEGTLEMNGFLFDVTNYKLRPSPNGQDYGEVILLLSEARRIPS